MRKAEVLRSKQQIGPFMDVPRRVRAGRARGSPRTPFQFHGVGVIAGPIALSTMRALVGSRQSTAPTSSSVSSRGHVGAFGRKTTARQRLAPSAVKNDDSDVKALAGQRVPF